MTRPAAATDFHVDVEGIGHFVFAKRKMSDEAALHVEYSKITQGVETPTAWLQLLGGWMAALKVLTVSAPEGWDIDEMDPLDEDTYENLGRVHLALRTKELSFRKGKTEAGQAKREGAGEGDGVLVSEKVQPGPD